MKSSLFLLSIFPLLLLAVPVTSARAEVWTSEQFVLSSGEDFPKTTGTQAVAIDEAGGAHVVHVAEEEFAPASFQPVLYYSFRASPSRSWTSTRMFATAGGKCRVSLAVDSNGTLHLTFTTQQGIYYLQKPWQGAWSANELVSSLYNPADEAGVSLALSRIGEMPEAAFTATNGGLVYAFRNSSGVWSSTTVDSRPNSGFFPSLVASIGFGGARIAHYKSDTGTLLFSRQQFVLPGGTSWSTITVDDTGDAGRSCSTALAGNMDVIIYHRDEGGEKNLMEAVFNATWTTRLIERSTWGPGTGQASGRQCQIYVDAMGNPGAVYTFENNEGVREIRHTRRHGPLQWAREESVFTPTSLWTFATAANRAGTPLTIIRRESSLIIENGGIISLEPRGKVWGFASMNFIDPFSPSGYIASADFFQDGERYWNYAYSRAASGGGTQNLHYTKISEGSLISNTGLASGDVYSSINIEPLPNGNVFVVAHVDSGSGYTIETFEAAWSGETTPQTLGTADSVTQTDLHVEPDGTIHLCYFGGGEIKLRRRAPGQTTWETRTIPNPGGARVCSLDVNEAGDVVLAWASDFAARIAYLPKSGAITTGSYPIAVRFPSTIDAVFSFNSGSTQRFLPLIFYVDQNNLMAADTSHSSVVAVGMPDDAAVRVLPPTSVKEIEVIYRGNGDDRQQIGHLTYNLLESSASRNDFGPLYGGFANNQLYATRDQLGFPAALTTNTLDMAICRPMDGLDDDEDGLPLVVEHAIDSNLYADDTNPAIGWTALVNGRVELNSRIPLPVLGFFQSATVPQPECGEFRYKHMLSFDLMNHFTYAELINLGAPVTDIGTATGTSMIFGAPHLNQSFDFSSTARASLPTAFSRLEIERVTK